MENARLHALPTAGSREAGAEFEPVERQCDREFIFHWIPPLIAGGKR